MPLAVERTGGKGTLFVFTELAYSATVIADNDITLGKGCRNLTLPPLLWRPNKTKTAKKEKIYIFFP